MRFGLLIGRKEEAIKAALALKDAIEKSYKFQMALLMYIVELVKRPP